MRDLDKAFRWAIPGAICIAAAVAWYSALRTSLVASTDFEATMLSSLGSTLGGLALLSVPTGFVVYQYYYYRYSRPVRWLVLVQIDVAAEVSRLAEQAGPPIDAARDRRSGDPYVARRTRLRVRAFGHCPSIPFVNFRPHWLHLNASGAELSPRWKECREVLRLYNRARERNWVRLSRVILMEPKDSALASEAWRLEDVYHMLGATRSAILLGSIFGAAAFTILAFVQGPEVSWTFRSSDANTAVVNALLLLGLLCTLGGMSVFFYYVAHSNRTHTLYRRIELLATLLRKRTEDLAQQPSGSER